MMGLSALTTPVRPMRTLEYTLAPSPMAARSAGDEWPVIIVSMTPYAMEASWPRRIGQAWARIPRSGGGGVIA